MAVVSLASGEDLAQLQLDYPVVGLVVQAKLKGEKPLQSETKALGRPTRPADSDMGQALFKRWPIVSPVSGPS